MKAINEMGYPAIPTQQTEQVSHFLLLRRWAIWVSGARITQNYPWDRELPRDGGSQKAKQKRLISVISLFSLVLERRAAGEKAPSSAHREKAKSAFFLANNGVPLRSVCAAGHPRQRRNFYRRQGAFTHGNGISTCHCTRVLPLYLQLAAAVLSPLPCHQCGHDERQRCPVEQPTSRRASPSSP